MAKTKTARYYAGIIHWWARCRWWNLRHGRTARAYWQGFGEGITFAEKHPHGRRL